jgi:transcriptional regulator with XRE-family HTH domain
MLSPRQLRAARGLLGWTQNDLAKAAGLHPNALIKIEREEANPRLETLARLKTALEMAGIRFRGLRGVEMKEDVFETLRFEGPDFIRRPTDDALTILKGPNDEALTVVTDERLFDEADAKENKRYYAHMAKTGFRERMLTTKSYTAFNNKDRSVYRWLPEKVLGTIAFVVYGDRTGFVQWRTRETLLIKNASLAATFRAQFDFLWQQARPFA